MLSFNPAMYMASGSIKQPNHVSLYQYSRYIGNRSGQPLKMKVNYNGQTFILFSRMNTVGMIAVASADLNNRNCNIVTVMGNGATAEAQLDSDDILSIYFYDSDHDLWNVWSDIIVLTNHPSELS